MGHVEKSIVVDVPVSAAYNQWTQFESFPHFMDGVKEVRQLDDKRLHWRAEIGGREKEWDAMIATQEPDRCVAWHSTSGPQNAGRVRFEQMDPTHTRVSLEMDFDPEGFVESAGDALGFPERQVTSDLKHFKEFIEQRGQETGSWRGEIHGSKVGSRGGPTL